MQININAFWNSPCHHGQASWPLKRVSMPLITRRLHETLLLKVNLGCWRWTSATAKRLRSWLCVHCLGIQGLVVLDRTLSDGRDESMRRWISVLYFHAKYQGIKLLIRICPSKKRMCNSHLFAKFKHLWFLNFFYHGSLWGPDERGKTSLREWKRKTIYKENFRFNSRYPVKGLRN